MAELQDTLRELDAIEQAVTALRTRYPDGNLDAHFIGAIERALVQVRVLRQLIVQRAQERG